MINAIQFIQQHGVEKAREVVEGAPSSATHFNQNSLGNHYAKEVLRKREFQWAWFNKLTQSWYYDFAEYNHFELSELKRFLDSLDIIKELGSVESAKANLFEMYDDSSCDWVHEKARLYDYKHLTVGRVKQAIADYEAIGGEHV